MEELRLTRPTEAMSGEISAYRQAMLDAGSEMDGCGPLSRMEDPAEWIAFCKTLDEGTNVPERWVPATQFVCLRGEKIVGMIQVRRELNDICAITRGISAIRCARMSGSRVSRRGCCTTC